MTKFTLLFILLFSIKTFSQTSKLNLLLCADGQTKLLEENFVFDACPRGIIPLAMFPEIQEIKTPIQFDLNFNKEYYQIHRTKKNKLLDKLSDSTSCFDKNVWVNSMFSLLSDSIKQQSVCDLIQNYIQKDSSVVQIDSISRPEKVKLSKIAELNWDKTDTSNVKLGIDISHHNGNINWSFLSKEKSPIGVDFVIMKATEGRTYRDKRFVSNWSNAKKNGFKRGAYHFYRQNTDPKLQAENFIRTVGNLSNGDIVPVLDIERYHSKPEIEISHFELIRDLKIFIETLENHYKSKVLIYTGKYYYQKYLKDYFPNQPFWLARYNLQDIPKNLSKKYVGWQLSARGDLDGIYAPVDLNLFSKKYFEEILIRNKN